MRIQTYRANTRPVIVRVRDAKQPRDITGATFVLTIASVENPTGIGTQLGQVAGVIVDAEGGVVRFSPPHVVAGEHWYDVEMTAADATIETIVKGRWSVAEPVNQGTSVVIAPGHPPIRRAIDYPSLQAFFDAAQEGDVLDWRGTHYGENVVVKGDKCTHLAGTIRTRSTVTINAENSTFNGHLWVIGLRTVQDLPADNYDRRVVTRGIHIDNCKHTVFDKISVEGCLREGIYAVGSIGMHLGTVRAKDCGSAAGGAVQFRLEIPFTRDVSADTGGPTSQVTQRSTLVVPLGAADDLLGDAQHQDIILIDDGTSLRPHTVRAVATSADGLSTEVTIYPWPDVSVTSGTLISSHGAALQVAGADMAGVGADSVTGFRTGIGLLAGSLYGGYIGGLTVNGGTGIGLQVAQRDAGGVRGHLIGAGHFEATVWDIVKLSRVVDNIVRVFVTTIPKDESKYVVVPPNGVTLSGITVEGS